MIIFFLQNNFHGAPLFSSGAAYRERAALLLEPAMPTWSLSEPIESELLS